MSPTNNKKQSKEQRQMCAKRIEKTRLAQVNHIANAAMNLFFHSANKSKRNYSIRGGKPKCA